MLLSMFLTYPFPVTSRRWLNAFVQRSVSLLENYTFHKMIYHGKSLHCHLIKTGVSSQKYVAVKLLVMYLDFWKSHEIDQMLKEFDGFNLVVSNCLITAHLRRGNAVDACKVFDEMPERNQVSWTALVSGLFRLEKADLAMFYFERNPFPDVFSYTAAINGLLQNEQTSQGVHLYHRMRASQVLPNAVTFTTILQACIDMGALGLGKSVLGQIIKLGFECNICVSNSLVKLFLKLGELASARKVFDSMEERDVVSWTTILDMYFEMGDLTEALRMFRSMPERNEITWSVMIARFSQCGDVEEAVRLFRQMIDHSLKPTISCYASIISALASMKALHSGKNIHAHVLKSGVDTNVFIGSSLVDMYCKCRSTRNGRSVFDSILNKNITCWNSMVAGYSLNGQLSEATELFNKIPNKNSISWNSLIVGHLGIENFDGVFEVFRRMILSGQQPNPSTFCSVLSACANLASVQKGEYAHSRALKLGLQLDTFVGTALVDMYAKSGSVESSRKIFDQLPEKNEIAWTAMIQGLAENGFGLEALHLFEEMEETSGIKPNELILLSVLFACSHCGLVDKGLGYFSKMEKVYGIKPNERHCTCVVDMLSRSGCLREAEMLVSDEPEANALAALLSGCRKHEEERIAHNAAQKFSELAAKKPGGLVLLSNFYAVRGQWHNVMNTRDLMEKKGVKKSAGCSWIEIRNQVHQFYSQYGTNHALETKLRWALELVSSEMHSQIH